ncbi:hypothetical protein F4556_007591 [Kitasatospora gansuensis]|uniref:Uncharacterized protein n=1 Tax=Kitasatospora gansuensis TaxID=258050 RepID=A0A7W7SKT5_9ACTN|nr:hypothetical protein [Kitasatospora gansuensis]MBB4951937.1 hypothetical protein [Kitasatospora gansuensis]
MTEQMCKSGGVHRLPDGEESWNSERCDLLVAAGLDKCLPCQDRLIAELSAELTDDFGRIFTTWVLGTLNRRQLVGASMPDTALELLGPNGGTVISPPSRRALRGVKLPRVTAGAAGDAMLSLDTKQAVAALTAMTPTERTAVLNDAMDGVIGSIAMPLPTL